MNKFDDYLKAMHENTQSITECLVLLLTALSHNSTPALQACREKVLSIKKSETELTRKVTQLAQEDHSFRMYISIPQLLSRIAEHVEKLIETINKKIVEDILFSDRAVSELTTLFHRLGEAMKSTSDLLVTKNTVLVHHINECEEDVEKKALEFATHHEDRLIEGLCLPVSAPHYLNMLNSLRCIAWDAKEIATKFSQN